MITELMNFKRMIIDSGLFERKRNGWYRGKYCPYCGDVKKHYYIHIDLDKDTPVSQYCFKCNIKGCINDKMLECYGLEWKGVIPRGKVDKRIDTGGNFKEYKLNEGVYSVDYMRKCIDYISGRLGVDVEFDDLKRFGVVLNPNDYAGIYLGGKVDDVNKIWFICTNGMLIGRDFLKKKDGWEKYCGNVNVDGRMLYTIKEPFDLYKDINVCICEGIMDAIGLWYHGNIENGVYISVLGRDYMSGIQYMLDRGIFGDSVCIRIYKDSDVKEVKIDKWRCMWFKSVDVYMNTIGKDFGLCKNEIEIEKCMEVKS